MAVTASFKQSSTSTAMSTNMIITPNKEGRLLAAARFAEAIPHAFFIVGNGSMQLKPEQVQVGFPMQRYRIRSENLSFQFLWGEKLCSSVLKQNFLSL